MERSRRRLLALAIGLCLVVVLSALLYQLGMAALENRPRTFWRSLEWVAETLSTTGYGADHTWNHPAMVLFVVLLQFAGVFLIFLIFPIYLIPVLEERFEARLPTSVEKISGHILVYRYGPAVASLLADLRKAELDTVIVEEDEETARRLLDTGAQVVYGRPEDGALQKAGLDDAYALIANGDDDENAAVILTARQAGFDRSILALVEAPLHRRPMRLAGASAVFTPRHILGGALAARASERISPTVTGAQQLLGKLRVSEVRLHRDSPLVGSTLTEAALGERTGATVVGQWVGGELKAPLLASDRLQPDGILLVLGSDESIAKLSEACESSHPINPRGPFLVAGYGEVGHKVAQLLRDAGEPVRVVDRQAQEGVDEVGDVLDPHVLEEAGAREARTVILALDSDSATLFATVVIKELVPMVPILARVNEAQNIDRIYRAGADFALSISQVAGQMLMRRLFGQEEVAIHSGLRILKTEADGLAGGSLSELAIRRRTGASVVAVARGEDVLVDLPSEFRFESGDTLYVCGSNEATRRFQSLFRPARQSKDVAEQQPAQS
jgi:Trk K+ transport system NAD-binding subunit